MNTKQKLGYMVVGGALVAVGIMVALLAVSPVTAQRDKFGDIECTSVRVVAGGTVTVYGKDGKLGATLGVDEDGGVVAAHGKDGVSGA